ncbi:MAG TPA: cupin domain-containing protein [Planctomycetota bacterium]|jgi:mannose-6-phosphate isomerase-like protein (cupin superfamily)|nr:cupin domain-containing protein [Planctomycetota bacterium]
MRTTATLALLLAAACATARPDYHAPGFVGGECVDLLAFADLEPLPPDQAVALLPLGKASEASHHLAIVREEPLHRHERHDLTVQGLRGEGWLRLVLGEGERSIRMAPGTVVLIPRGTPHAFRATGGKPYVALAVFSPPYDGKDAVLVER